MACLVLLVAQLVYVLFGFGANMIAVGTLAMLLPEIRDVVVLMLLVNTPSELFVVGKERAAISWRGVLLIMIGVAVGIAAGTILLRFGQPTVLLAVLGLFLVVAGSAFLLVPARLRLRWPAWVGPVTGLVSGTLTGLFGTGGPPLIFYYQLGGADKSQFRGNLMAIFLLMTFCRLPSYAVAGLITAERVWSGLVLMPAVLLGAWLGNRIHLELDERTFRRLVSVALVLIGLVLIGDRFLS